MENFDLIVTDSAVSQIKLITENDFTLKDQFFRVQIGGKGCEGFTYKTGFTEKNVDDITFKKFFSAINYQLEILVDPFTAHYTSGSTLDYLLETQTNEEGFILTNPKESQHRGKFFKDTSKLPPWAKA